MTATQEQIDEARWLAVAPDLQGRVNAAVATILGREVPFVLLVFPQTEKTLTIQNARMDIIRSGIEGCLRGFDTLRTHVKG